MMQKRIAIVVCAAAVALSGCAAEVVKGSTSAPLHVAPEARKTVVLNVTGSDTSTKSKDWEAFKGEWRDAMKPAAEGAGMSYSFQDGEAKPTGEPGTLVVVYINDYRYLSTGLRYAVGVMAGNAYVDSKARFVDLKSGAELGERTYNTTSHTIEGVFSPMTSKQLAAICREMVADIAAQ